MEKHKKRNRSPSSSRLSLRKRLTALEQFLRHDHGRRHIKEKLHKRVRSPSSGSASSNSNDCVVAKVHQARKKSVLAQIYKPQEIYHRQYTPSPSASARVRRPRHSSSSNSSTTSSCERRESDRFSADQRQNQISENNDSQNKNVDDILELDTEILTCLGDDLDMVNENSFELNPHIEKRWSLILKDGLSKEKRGTFEKIYSPKQLHFTKHSRTKPRNMPNFIILLY